MIPYFRDNLIKDSAIIYSSTFEQIKKLYAKSPEQAGELAIAAIELALTGEISSDDFMIDLLLENIKVSNKRAQNNYDKKKEANRQRKIADQQLDVIAEMYNRGMKQKDIAAKIGTTPQTISNRLGTIRTEYPELLKKNQENQVNQIYDNGNDNVNDNGNGTKEIFERSAQNPQGSPCVQAHKSPDEFTF